MSRHNSGTITVRYPRGNGAGAALLADPQRLSISKGRIMREGNKVAILSLGTRLQEALKAADILEAKGLPTTVADLRFAKPLDETLIRKLLTTHEVAVTIEEGSIGGLGAHVLTLASDCGLSAAGLKLPTLRPPQILQVQAGRPAGREGTGVPDVCSSDLTASGAEGRRHTGCEGSAHHRR